MYKKCNGKVLVFLVLYVDDILLIGNDVESLSDVRIWLSKLVKMMDKGEYGHLLEIKIFQGRKKRMLCLSQATYIDTVVKRFSMESSKKGFMSV